MDANRRNVKLKKRLECRTSSKTGSFASVRVERMPQQKSYININQYRYRTNNKQRTVYSDFIFRLFLLNIV